MVFQSGNLLDHLSVEQNVVMARRLAGMRDAGRVSSLLAEVGLKDRAKANPTTLSGGEASRAGLAVAVANDPAVILADEPTGELDEVAAARLLSLLRRRAGAGAAVLIVTHNPRVAAGADRRIELLDGQVA
jgi:putative ABC transport system ATP-binding protein